MAGDGTATARAGAAADTTARTVIRVGGEHVTVFQDGPADAPALLLIHGFGACAAWWDPVIPCLAGSYRLIRTDLLGHGTATAGGAGSGPAADYTITGQARRLRAVLDALGVPRPAAVLGHSTGGSVATALAEQDPSAVTALVLIDTGPDLATDTSGSPLSALLFRRFPGALLWRLLRSAIVRKSLASAVSTPTVLPDALAAATRGMPHHALAATAHGAIAYLAQRPVPDRISTLGLPALVLFGTADRRWNAPAALESYRAAGTAQVVPLAGIGHTPMYEAPERTCALVREFLGTPTPRTWSAVR